MKTHERSERLRNVIAGFAALFLLLPTLVLAHGVEEHATPAQLWREWNFDPLLLLMIGGSSVWYAVGWRRVRQRTSGQSRELRRKALWFVAGMTALLLALVSPLDAVSTVLVSVHMVQHMLLIVVAAPLLIVSAPLPMFILGLPDKWRASFLRGSRHSAIENTWRVLTLPLVAWVLHGAFLWLWHAPALYQAALENRVIHDLEHASFLFNALLFWWVVLRSLAGSSARNGMAVLLLFTTFLHGGLLAALMTFSSAPWYPAYVNATTAWGLSATKDQQLAGLIMWLPAGITYMIAGVTLLGLWLRRMDARSRNESAAV